MCCLFGLVDRANTIPSRRKSQILHALAAESEARGTDATGIAYNRNSGLTIYKRPIAGQKMRFYLPNETAVIMGHTRMTTGGSPKHNANNHPFLGRTKDGSFALAHNGILYNDYELRLTHALPKSSIETDSYVMVQLIEQAGELSFATLSAISGELFGPFAFSILDSADNLWFIRGENPLELRHYADIGVYLYASTAEILDKAVARLPFNLGVYRTIGVKTGEIIRLDADGSIHRAHFVPQAVPNVYAPYFGGYSSRKQISYSNAHNYEDEYVATLMSEAERSGLYAGIVEKMMQDGYTLEEIEDFIYCGSCYQ